MSAGEYCNRDVVVVSKKESVQEAISLMRSQHVGDVVVVDAIGENAKPIGILTDRDIVLEIMAEAVNLDDVCIDDVMSFELVTVPEDEKLLDCLELMRNKGIRRLIVVDNQQRLAGILTIDDILELVAEQLNDIVGLISTAHDKEERRRPSGMPA